jgi:hypothetical protein
MVGSVEEALAAAQRAYDDLEARLLARFADFQIYLHTKDQVERSSLERGFVCDDEFQRWRAHAAEICALYKARDSILFDTAGPVATGSSEKSSRAPDEERQLV